MDYLIRIFVTSIFKNYQNFFSEFLSKFLSDMTPDWLYSLPNDRFLDWSKLKTFADNNINATQKLKLVFARVENIVVKGENAGYQHFLLFPQCFLKASICRIVKSQDCVVKS